MTTAIIPQPAAVSLALAAVATYKRRLEGIPTVSDDQIAEAQELYQTRRRGAFGATEKQIDDARRLLEEQNVRLGFTKLHERAQSLLAYFMFVSDAQEPGSGLVYVHLSFDDWMFLARANEVKESDLK